MALNQTINYLKCIYQLLFVDAKKTYNQNYKTNLINYNFI